MERKRLDKEPEAETPLPHLHRASSMPASTSPPAQGPHAREGISDPSPRRDREHSAWTGAGLAMHLPARMRDVLKRYGLALALASLTLFLRSQLPLREGNAVYQLPIAAVVLSAWYGGRGPGLFASLICATAILYRFIPPANSFELPPDYALGFFLFIALSGLAGAGSWLCYFRALQLGEALRVAPIDRLSGAVTLVLAVLLLHERAPLGAWLGTTLMVVGAVIVARS